MKNFLTAPFKGIGKNDEERINRAKSRLCLDFVCPKAYKGTSRGEVYS